MAMLRLGKLKFRFKDGGVDYKWGDGEPKRFALGKRGEESPEEIYDDIYDESDDMSEMDYDDAYADDGYEEGYDDVYEDDGYVEDYPEEEVYDDGYDDEGAYYEDDYAEYPEEGYDDRYSDVDADDGYMGEYPEGTLGNLLYYVDENDWVTYLLLVLLPPVGIYLLWRKRQFSLPLRYGVSAASAVWFILMIVLIISLLSGGNSEYPGNTNVTLPPSTAPVVSASTRPTATPTPKATVPVATPSPTAIGGGMATPASGSLVYASGTGTFYHLENTCELINAGESVTQVTLENAQNRGKYACPACNGEAIYYGTEGGKWYHLDKECNMVGAVIYSEQKAKDENKTACPVCVLHERDNLYDEGNVQFITSGTTDRSGIEVWCRPDSKWYHLTKDCQGMQGATKGKLRDALLLGKTACPECCAVSGTIVYCTKGGTYYHTSNCESVSGAKPVTLAEALVLGKARHTSCLGDGSNINSGNGGASGEYYVYATPTGSWYHIDSKCGGMADAVRVTLSSMLEINRPACPTCCSGADMTVYASQGGTYYHSYATCSNMPNAKQTTLAAALSKGYQRCTKCWGGNAGGGSDDSGSTPTADEIMVYARQDSRHYHTKSNCSGMSGASHISLSVAMSAGKTACPTCAAAAESIVYSNDGGKYYHKASTCTDMPSSTARTLAQALLLGQSACPTCFAAAENNNEGNEENNGGQTMEPVADFKVGTSGIKVYASPTEKYFHTDGSCGGRTGLSQVALEVALNYGRKACPSCAASAANTVYATANGRYYHVSKNCAGTGAVSGDLASALAMGYTACPYCVGNTEETPDNSGEIVVGTSGIKVYATVEGKYYHADKVCGGEDSVQITLETALIYGKKACPTCLAIAERTVYAVPGSYYYHSNKTCAGEGAISGTFANALALGMKACPNCIGSNFNAGTPESGEEYTAPAETVVYVDLYSDQFYYHKKSSCESFGMTGGTEETLEFAKDFGYARCPYCNPPSDIA